MRYMLICLMLILSSTLNAQVTVSDEEFSQHAYKDEYSMTLRQTSAGDDVKTVVLTQEQFQSMLENLNGADLAKTRVTNEFWYIVLLCLLSLISLTIVLSFLRGKQYSAKDIVSATGLTLIIFATIILVLVVSTSEQLTAAIGVLGAIAGYLFRSVQEGTQQQSNQ